MRGRMAGGGSVSHSRGRERCLFITAICCCKARFSRSNTRRTFPAAKRRRISETRAVLPKYRIQFILDAVLATHRVFESFAVRHFLRANPRKDPLADWKPAPSR